MKAWSFDLIVGIFPISQVVLHHVSDHSDQIRSSAQATRSPRALSLLASSTSGQRCSVAMAISRPNAAVSGTVANERGSIGLKTKWPTSWYIARLTSAWVDMTIVALSRGSEPPLHARHSR